MVKDLNIHYRNDHGGLTVISVVNILTPKLHWINTCALTVMIWLLCVRTADKVFHLTADWNNTSSHT